MEKIVVNIKSGDYCLSDFELACILLSEERVRLLYPATPVEEIREVQRWALGEFEVVIKS